MYSLKLKQGKPELKAAIANYDKPWKVKLAVVYREKAGNTKAARITCSIVVR